MADDIFSSLVKKAEGAFLKLIPANVKKWFDKEYQWIKKPANRAKAAAATIAAIGDVKKALPIVQTLAALAGLPTIPQNIIDGAVKAGTTVTELANLEIAADSGDEAAKLKRGQLLLTTGAEALRLTIKPGDTFLGKVVKDTEEIQALLPTQLQTVTQLAVNVAKAAGIAA